MSIFSNKNEIISASTYLKLEKYIDKLPDEDIIKNKVIWVRDPKCTCEDGVHVIAAYYIRY